MINLDNNDANSDWIRSSAWDLPRTPESLLYKIGVDRWEHFKTLPAFKAIPEGLEAEVDALVRARKANNPDLVKYDPDQPRDERGRFGSNGGGSKYTPEATSAAKSKYAEAAAAEPAITATMEKVSEKVGGKMAGLEFRLKTEESLARKIDANAVKYGGDREEAAANISDANRYTMTFEPQGYSNGIVEAVRDLENEGYSLNVKNYWNEDNPYKGVNVAATAPDGTRFELQFHTPESLDVKENALHGLYEQFRAAPDESTRLDLHNQMVAISAQTVVPSGIEQLSASWSPIAEPYAPAIKSDRVVTEGRLERHEH